MRVMKSSLFIAVRYLFTAVPAWLWLAQVMAVSLFQMGFFVYVTKFADNPDIDVAYVALGNALQLVAFSTVSAVAGISGGEKHAGTMQVIMQTPTRLYTVFLGKALFQIVAGLFTVTLSLSYATFIFGVDLSKVDIAAMAAVILVTCFAMTGFGLMVSCVGMYLRSSAIVASFLMYLTLIFCGVNFPVSYLPEALRPLSAIFPLTYGIEAMREAAIGASLVDVSGNLMIMAVLGTAMAVAGHLLFDTFERLARKAGTLDMF